MKFLHPANLTVNGGGPIIGQPVVNGNPNDILYINAAGLLAQNSQFTYNEVTGAYVFSGSSGSVSLVTSGLNPSWFSSLNDYLFTSDNYPSVGLLSIQSIGRLVSIGDYESINNGTYILVNDTSKFIYLQTAGPSIILNGTTGPIDYTSKSHTFKTATYTGGIAQFNETGTAALGDVGGVVFGTTLIVNDTVQTVTVSGPPYNFSNGFFNIDILQQYISIGDQDGAQNNTYILVNDSAQDISMRTGSFGVFSSAYPAAGGIFTIDAVTGVVNIGDSAGAVNNTYISIDDTAQTVSINLGGIYAIAGGTYGTGLFGIDIVQGSAFIGDYPQADNGTSIFVDDVNQNILFKASNGIFLGNNQVAMGTIAPDTTAVLQIDSTTAGFLPPRMTTGQRVGIISPAEGLMVYDLTLHHPFYYDGSSWVQI